MLTKQEIDSLRAEWAGLMGRHTVFELLDEIEHLRDQLKEEIAYSSKLRENLREVEPYCREPALAVVEDRYTWTAERCSVCSAEFVQGYGTHKKNCPLYEKTT